MSCPPLAQRHLPPRPQAFVSLTALRALQFSMLAVPSAVRQIWLFVEILTVKSRLNCTGLLSPGLVVGALHINKLHGLALTQRYNYLREKL